MHANTLSPRVSPHPEELIWMDGEFLPLAQARVSIEDRGLLFADGIYEVIAAFDGVPHLLVEHLDRWDRSAEGMRIQPRYGRDTRVDVIHELLKRFSAPRVSVYGQLTRGAARRAHTFPAAPRPMEFWFARELQPYQPVLFSEGVKVITRPDERWLNCWIKSISLAPNCFARQDAAEQGAFEAIFHREDGVVTEGAATNFFVVKDGVIRTHPVTKRILSGCTREFVLQVARQHGLAIREEAFDLTFMRNVDEAFITSTTINVMPVTRIDDAPVADGKVGPVVQKLMALTDAAVRQLREDSLAALR
ncbi:aminotransferase class IV [Candidatus Sumerlaeota bacterium]|nr:aminotransferase class IV [Candidatus Sumerlaeota bacterium]